MYRLNLQLGLNTCEWSKPWMLYCQRITDPLLLFNWSVGTYMMKFSIIARGWQTSYLGRFPILTYDKMTENICSIELTSTSKAVVKVWTVPTWGASMRHTWVQFQSGPADWFLVHFSHCCPTPSFLVMEI